MIDDDYDDADHADQIENDEDEEEAMLKRTAQEFSEKLK